MRLALKQKDFLLTQIGQQMWGEGGAQVQSWKIGLDWREGLAGWTLPPTSRVPNSEGLILTEQDTHKRGKQPEAVLCSITGGLQKIRQAFDQDGAE